MVLEHDRIHDVLVDMLKMIFPTAFIRVPDRDQSHEWWLQYSPDVRPDIVVLHFYGREKHAIIHVTVARHRSGSVVGAASRTPLHTASARERAKNRMYRNVPTQHTFVPFIVEGSGALGRDAASFIERCSVLHRGALVQERDRSTWSARTFSPFWQQRLSVMQHSIIGLVGGITMRAAEDAYLHG